MTNKFDIPSYAKKDPTRRAHARIVLHYRRLVAEGMRPGAAIDQIVATSQYSFRSVYRILATSRVIEKN